ncbi:bile acid:Na+ symporter, BASS family [Marinospirillum celere]|uniref:Bile acid:Na+ symporter, BASS family n=1 Tax=Marinospirillum celere TaxID=1122252 RepID=A0A1I1HWU7_9GAMM|nr:bile acid:sodium symporter family protein [Marinospirillum celere]SFC28414.1 bile acid:Na+ symporter, BASS family [Marinospirillum celere]
MKKLLHNTNQMFPVWALLFAAAAYFQPSLFNGYGGYILYLLAAIMFFMGLTLTPADFLRVFKRPDKILLGTGIQFLLMPLIAWILAKALLLGPELTVGMILVGATAGGTASNVMVYLAGGKVALSVTMTLFSSLVAVAATPILTRLYVGQSLEVPVVDMMKTLAWVILLPIFAGVVVNRLIQPFLRKHEPWLATGSMAGIVLVIAIVVSLNQSQIASLGPILALAVMLHNLAGLAAGYWGAKLLRCDERECRTIAIEVGMQNSGLAAGLAAKYFGASAALPGALFSVWHNISGALLAGHWKRVRVKDGS